MKKEFSSIFEEQYGAGNNHIAKRYSMIYNLLAAFEKNRLQKVTELITDKNLAVLDIGCGDGTFLYKNRHKWRSIIGVDVVKKLLNIAQKRNYGVSAEFIHADFGRNPIPYSSGSFDIVISISTLQYIYDIDLLFQEIRRVLKPEGKFIFEVPNSAVFWRRLNFLRGRLPRTSQFIQGWDAGVIHYFPHYDLSNFIKSYKYNILSVSCSGIFDYIRQSYPSLLGSDLIYVTTK